MNAPHLFPLALLLSLPAMAEVNLVYHVDLQLQAGRSTQDMTRDILLEDDSDVARNRVRQLEYRPEVQTVTLLEAYTVLPDGRRVPVPASDMRSSKLIDGVVWDGKNPAAYAASFKIKA